MRGKEDDINIRRLGKSKLDKVHNGHVHCDVQSVEYMERCYIVRRASVCIPTRESRTVQNCAVKDESLYTMVYIHLNLQSIIKMSISLVDPHSNIRILPTIKDSIYTSCWICTES